MTMNEEQSAFSENLGRCIAQWSHVEDGLFQCYMVALGQLNSILPAQAGFYAVQSPEGKLSVSNSAVRFCLLEIEDRSADMAGLWKSLVKKVEKRRTRRNQLAHFVSMENKPGRRVMLRPALFNPNAPDRTPFHVAELKVIARSFGRISTDLMAFSHGLVRHLTGDDKAGFMPERFDALIANYREQQKLNNPSYSQPT
jgi:hypothetical protein